jgi:Flp pilus assembly protein TadB
VRSFLSGRFSLAALLAVATLLFAIGVIAERSSADEQVEPTASAESGEAAHAAEGEGAHAAEEAPSTEGGASESSGEELAGIDFESTPLIVLAVLAGLALTAVAATALGRRRAFLLAVVVIALAWAVLDVRELFHQLDESRAGIAAVAVAVAVLHFLAAAVAGRGASRASATLG